MGQKIENELRLALSKVVREVQEHQFSSHPDYARYALMHNPFPPAGVADVPEPLVQLPEAISRFGQFFQLTYGGERYGGLTIVGDYGMGKTHWLRYFEHAVNELAESYASERPLAIYVENPGKSPRDIVHRIIETIGQERISRYLWGFVKDTLAERIPKEPQAFVGDKKMVLPLLPDTISREGVSINFKGFLDTFIKSGGDLQKLADETRGIVDRELCGHPGVASKFVSLLFEPFAAATKTWNSLVGLTSTREFERKEAILLRSVIHLLRNEGYRHLYILLDEFEDIANKAISVARRQEYFSALRILLDRDLRHRSIIIAMTDQALTMLKQEAPALHDRIWQFHFTLKPLDGRTAQEFVSEYTRVARVENPPAGISSIFPFSEQLVEKLRMQAGSNIRQFLTECRRALELAKEQKSDPPLGEEVLDIAGD